MSFLRNLFAARSENPQPQPVVVVSGLPRSGTSMMMKMLVAGGLEPVIDGQREADIDNPKGYYEFERVKGMDKGDTAWLEQAQGKVVKVISALLEYLPATYEYRILFMNREMTEVLASQNKMLQRRGETGSVDDDQMGYLLAKHVRSVKSWLANQPNMSLLEMDYGEMVTDPARFVPRINRFLGGGLDEDQMLAIVDPDLYRNRASES